MSLRAVRRLTPKAMEAYETRVQDYQLRLRKSWVSVSEITTTDLNVISSDPIKLKQLKTSVFELYDRYDVIHSEFCRYLRSVATKDSLELVEHIISEESYNRRMANSFVDKIRALKFDTASATSGRSNGSSKLSSRARARLAKVAAAHAEKTAELERRKAEIEESEMVQAANSTRRKKDIEIDIKLLQERQKAAEADIDDSGDEFSVHNVGVPDIDKNSRTEAYVEATATLRNSQPTEFVGLSSAKPMDESFTKYLLKRDILMSKLSIFNEQPETFPSWKATIKSVVAETGASSSEEIDLIIKWLGFNAQKQAISLKGAYIYDPSVSLNKIWTRLNERYGAPENIHSAIMKKLETFPKLTNKQYDKLYELSDILAEVQGLKEDPKYRSTLSYFDSSSGVNSLVNKLPYNLQEKWMSHATEYKRRHQSHFPPFSVFANFISDQSKMRNDPSFRYSNTESIVSSRPQSTRNHNISVRKTEIEEYCPIHIKAKHQLSECNTFQRKTTAEKGKFLRENHICFKCINSCEHRAKDCVSAVQCVKCGSQYHLSVMHKDNDRSQAYGGERSSDVVNNKFTDINGDFCSCAKILPVYVFSDQNPNNVIKCYAIIDDQSNKSLGKPELFDKLGITGDQFQYCLNSCAGKTVASGRRANCCNVVSIDASVSYKLPTVIECVDIPSSKSEICTPDIVRDFSHLSHLANVIPAPDANTQILLLLGRDIIDAHHVLDQIVGPPGAPFAQRLSLGWVVIGDVCVRDFHAQSVVNVCKTQILGSGRPSLFTPCHSIHAIVENNYCYDPVFVKKADDNDRSLSVDDREFLQIMDEHMQKDESGSWVAPLPFRQPIPRLPNNRDIAFKRAKNLHFSLSKDAVKKQLLVKFMSQIIVKGHAEVAPSLSAKEECWYLPIFSVTHPQKPGQVRGVFDSSAQCQGVSLNSVLLSGPDLTNNLLGVLLRFRTELVPVTVDIEQMFYSFRVEEKHRDFLRFWWYKDNDPEQDLIEYRMCVHVFGNSPSPAVAAFGLRKSVENSDKEVKDFVTKNFYVDDGVTSKPSSGDIVDLIKKTQSDLSSCGLRLHKIASSNVEVMKAFSVTDLAKDLRCVDFDMGVLPIQRSLGVVWDLDSDCFTFKVESSSRPLTRRGILSTVNSLYDPLGIVAPVTIVGKLILRDIMSVDKGWDEQVSPCIESKFLSWRNSLQILSEIQMCRRYFDKSVSDLLRLEIHIFSDASELAISSVAYIVGISVQSKQVSFLLGKSKVAPVSGHTIPRLELCAAVLAVEISDTVLKNIDIPINMVKYYTDSRVVLGYINNHSRRFHTYVSNRVHRIRQSSNPNSWNYICSSENPADIGSRGSDPHQLQKSMWLTGPSRLFETSSNIPEFFPLLDPDDDSEIRPEVNVLKTNMSAKSASQSWSCKFSRFSVWKRLVLAISVLHQVARYFRKKLQCGLKPDNCEQILAIQYKIQAENFVLQRVQAEVYNEELDSFKNLKPILKHSSLYALDPFLDDDGLIKVGGRLERSSLSHREKHPIILPGKHHVSKLLAFHCHELVQHQGRLFTEGSIRSAGYWITGGKRLVSSLIYGCVMCKKRRGHFEQQKMSDLPSDRVDRVPPFSHVGVDVFGPWEVVARKTRGGYACAKRWAVMFTCLTIRAVHIEVVDEMSSSAFINALRRFIAVRGSVKIFRSDRGTNFVGSTDSLRIDTVNVEDAKTKSFLYDSGSVWIFNPPHSSHFGGTWERMIGVTRRILESMLGNVKNLTHDVLVTTMAEVSAIINARPIVPVSCDIENPDVLSPSSLLNQKTIDIQPIGDMDVKLLYKDQWKRVRYLADQFWVRWKRDYLQTLQQRRKWNSDHNPVEVGDTVLLKEKDVHRNYWPLGLICRVFPSIDGRVRKAEVSIFRDEKRALYTRPIVDMVLLVKGNTEY